MIFISCAVFLIILYICIIIFKNSYKKINEDNRMIKNRNKKKYLNYFLKPT